MANPNGNPQNLTPGNPGNKGGGNIKSKIRQRCREGFAKSLDYIASVAEGKGSTGNSDPEYGESIRAADVLAKYGLGEAKQVLPEEFIEAAARALAQDERIPPECIPDFTQRLIEELQELD